MNYLSQINVLSLDQKYDEALAFVNARAIQFGHILPISKDLFHYFFPPATTNVLVSKAGVISVFTYRSGSEKTAPFMSFRIIADTLLSIKETLNQLIKLALAQEKLFLRTTVYGYNKEQLDYFRDLGFKISAEIPNLVSFDGSLYSYYFLTLDLRDKYNFKIERRYHTEELYPLKDIEKPAEYQFYVRGIQYGDFDYFERCFNQLNVFRTMGRGVFEGTIYFNKEIMQKRLMKRDLYSLVCIDLKTEKPVGFISVNLHSQDVLKGTGSLGMFVDERYQGLGAGTLMMQNAILLAKRLHLRMLHLSVFENNAPGIALYKKFEFFECGKLLGWFQNGYINEIVMAKKL